MLPTSGTARYTGGLSVFTFLRIRTWMEITDAVRSQELVRDAAALARFEGLEGHARSAETRKMDKTTLKKKAPSRKRAKKAAEEEDEEDENGE